MFEDSDSSDDDILKPNGYVDLGAESVVLDFADTEDTPPLKKKCSRKRRAVSNDLYDTSRGLVPDSQPTSAREALKISDSSVIEDDLEDYSDIVASSLIRSRSRKSRKVSSVAACPPLQTRRVTENSSSSGVLNESDCVVLSPEASPHNIFDDSITPQSSFCFDVDEDLPAPVCEDPNVEVTVRVVWKGHETKRFSIRKFQKIKELYTYYAELEGVDEGRILFTLHDKPVSPNDTPVDLKIGVSSLEGGIIDAVDIAPHSQQNSDSQSQVDPNALRLQVQRRGVKEKHTVFTFPDEKISVLIAKLSEELGIQSASIKLMFDGEELLPNNTPEDYDMDENDLCVDLIMKSN